LLISSSKHYNSLYPIQTLFIFLYPFMYIIYFNELLYPFINEYVNLILLTQNKNKNWLFFSAFSWASSVYICTTHSFFCLSCRSSYSYQLSFWKKINKFLMSICLEKSLTPVIEKKTTLCYLFVSHFNCLKILLTTITHFIFHRYWKK
jgi:hypothetical protein